MKLHWVMKIKVLIVAVLAIISSAAYGQKKIALLETRVADGSTKVSAMQKNIVRGELRNVLVGYSGYEAFTRMDIDLIMKEQNFQRTGHVNDEQIKKLGEISGADYICVSTLSKANNEFYLEAYLINVETGQISNPATQYGKLFEGKMANMLYVCRALAEELIGMIDGAKAPLSKLIPKTDYTETALGVNMRMIYVEGGTFEMGCTGDDSVKICNEDANLKRQTTVSSFYIGMLEVTQEQWFSVMGGYDPEEDSGQFNQVITPDYNTTYCSVTVGLEFRRKENDLYGYYHNLLYENAASVDEMGEIMEFIPVTFVGDGPGKVGKQYPMCFVSIGDAEVFLDKLSEATGKKYVLPTEAQWEYAARGGKKARTTKYAGSDTIEKVGWFRGNSDTSVHVCGSLKPNELGIYDMSGNVSEWCSDYYSDSYIQYDNINPHGPEEDAGYEDSYSSPRRVVRGGAWWGEDEFCSIIMRNWQVGSVYKSDIGFRVVCIP